MSVLPCSLSQERCWSAELRRIRGVFLTAMGGEETQIEASFCEAHHNRTGAEVYFNGDTCRNNLRRIPPPKSKRVRRVRVPTSSLVTASVRATPLEGMRLTNGTA
jgi:hypothetical protein